MYYKLPSPHLLKIGMVLCLLIGSCKTKVEKVTSEVVASNDQLNMEKKSLLRHVVLFRFTPDISAGKLKEIEEAFANLPSKIPEIYSFEWGVNNSPEGLNKELTHCFLVTFESEKDRDSYLPHPSHKEFISLAESYIKDVVVVDYWTN